MMGDLSTFNEFCVGALGERIVVLGLQGLAAPISKEQAVQLAAQLLVMATLGEEDEAQARSQFDELVTRIRNA